MVDLSDRMTDYVNMLFLSLCCGALQLLPCASSCIAQNDHDSWNVTKASNQLNSDTVERWCEINGQRIKFTNFPVPGYRPCGTLSAQKTCDPTGKRFIGSSSAPYSYLDCSIGPRIQVSSTSTYKDYREAETQSAEDIGASLSALERKRKDYDSLLDSTDKEPEIMDELKQTLQEVMQRNLQLKDLLESE